MTLLDTAKQIPAYEAAERYASVNLTRKGNKLWCCCPIHGEKTASCSFNLDGQYQGMFYCFGCHAHGSSIDLVMLLFNIDRTEAAKKICADFGLTPDSADPKEIAAWKERKLRAEKNERLTRSIHEASALAYSVCGGMIAWCNDEMMKVPDDDAMETDIAAYGEIIADAAKYQDALRQTNDPLVKWKLLTIRIENACVTTKEKIEILYRFLHRLDAETGTDYLARYAL